MPQKIQMYITNNHPIPRFAPNVNNVPVETFIQNKNMGGLKSSSIIGRIHNVKPGCGSCGK